MRALTVAERAGAILVTNQICQHEKSILQNCLYEPRNGRSCLDLRLRGGGDDASPKPVSQISSDSRDTGPEVIRKLRDDCPELHNSEQMHMMACAAGTYDGKDIATGAACRTVLTADGYVSFINGATSVGTFQITTEFLYHKSQAGTGSSKHWIFHLEGKNREPLLLKSRRASIRMTANNRYGRYLDIVQKNTDPNIGPTLNATCRVSF